MFEKIHCALNGDWYYHEFTTDITQIWDYRVFMQLVWDSEREITKINLCEDATDPWERNISPGNASNTPEEFKNLPEDAFIGVDNIMIFFADQTVISYSMRGPLISVESPESDFELDAYLCEYLSRKRKESC